MNGKGVKRQREERGKEKRVRKRVEMHSISASVPMRNVITMYYKHELIKTF